MSGIPRLFLDMCLDRAQVADLEVSWADRYRKDVRQLALMIETVTLTLRHLVEVVGQIEDQGGRGLPISADPAGYRALDNARELLKGFTPFESELKGQAGPKPEEEASGEEGTRP